MSYVNGTTHYNLPQTVGTDKRDWTDTNQAFADIDSAIYNAVETAETGATNIQALQTDLNALTTRVTSAEADISTNTTDIGVINTNINTINADIADVRQDAQDMICAYNEATATSSHSYSIGDYFIYNDVLYKVTAPIAIGGTIVPNTNCSATNVVTELDNLFDGVLIASVAADGVKTLGTLLNELYAKVSGKDLKHTTLIAGTLVFHASGSDTFSNVLLTPTDSRIREITLNASTSSLVNMTTAVGGATTYNDESSQIWDNGSVIAIYR